MGNTALIRAAIHGALGTVRRDPDRAIARLLPVARKLIRNETSRKQLALFEEAVENKSCMYRLTVNILRDLDRRCVEKLATNVVVNAGWLGNQRVRENRDRYDLNIPWAILMDPTSGCNLRCRGCWAEGYTHTDQLEYELLDRIITEGKELGIYFYLYSGGEPMLRRRDIIRLAEKHGDCYFLSFTNATLVDDEMADEMQRVANITVAISIEGNREETDSNRGAGSWDAMVAAMGRLKARGVPFGFSTRYHSGNVERVASDAWVQEMVDRGCIFGWYFTYLPIGAGAAPELMVSPAQREHMYHRVRELRRAKPIFLLDFWNDGEYVFGCIAGGRNYFHINARGDVEPCAFIHYSDTNIRTTSLLDALRSPLFQQYRAHQPVNRNHLRPCPLLDNPAVLREMVHATGAVSTDTRAPESVDTLTARTEAAARAWASTADRLWQANPRRESLEQREWPGKPHPERIAAAGVHQAL